MKKAVLKSRFAQNTLLCLFSFALVLLCLELCFRLFEAADFNSFIAHSTKNWLDQEVVFNKKVARASPSLGYEWLPNVTYKWLSTNSLGMYDKERARQKQPGVYRIIFLGDSTTACSQYVKMLEDDLNRDAAGAGRRFEAWNCAVIGYSLIQYCRAIEEKWLACDPDMIVIGFCLNDFDTTPLVLQEGEKLVGYFPRQEILPQVNPFLFKHSELYRFLVKISLRTKKYGRPGMHQESISVFEKTIDSVRARNVRLLVVVLGLVKKAQDCQQDRLDNYGRIISFCVRQGIEFIDTMPLFQKVNPERLSLYDDIHFNDEASVIVAGAIREYLIREGIAPVSNDPYRPGARKK